MTERAPGWAESIRVGVVAATMVLAAAAAAAPADPPAGPTSAAALAPRPPRRIVPHDPFPEISGDRLFATLEELTAIGRGSLFRTSASRGEAEAFDLVVRRLGELGFLAGSGMTIERQPFRTYPRRRGVGGAPVPRARPAGAARRRCRRTHSSRTATTSSGRSVSTPTACSTTPIRTPSRCRGRPSWCGPRPRWPRSLRQRCRAGSSCSTTPSSTAPCSAPPRPSPAPTCCSPPRRPASSSSPRSRTRRA